MARRYLVVNAYLVVAAMTAALGSAFAQDTKPVSDPDSLIKRSKVWLPTDIASMNLKLGPTGPGAFGPGATVTCEYLDKDLTGASPKFACRTPDGDELKVKYGGANGEV